MSYSEGIYDEDACAETEINHSVLMVGYGKDEETGIEYFILKNSWGKDWGEKGYGRLRILTEDDSSLKYTTMAGGGYC
jgi:C1A family cysteine protease